MFRKIFLTIGLFIIADLIVACCEEEPLCFNVTNASIENLDNSGPKAELQTGNSIPAKAFALKLAIESEETICYLKNFSNRAYATSCRQDVTMKQQVESVKIFSDQGFSPEFPAGSDLTPAFKGDFFNVNTDLKENYGYYEQILYLIKMPDSVRSYRFIFNVKLTDGTMFTDTTSTVFLTL